MNDPSVVLRYGRGVCRRVHDCDYGTTSPPTANAYTTTREAIQQPARCAKHTTGAPAIAITNGAALCVPPTTPSSYSHLNDRLELARPCRRGMDLLKCPDFHHSQPYGNIEKPIRFYWARRYECPACYDDDYDMGQTRMILAKRMGWKVGLGPAKRDLGVEVYPREVATCCAIM